MTLTRTTVFESRLLHVRHVRCRPASAALGELQAAPADLLALPLSGVFAVHDGPRRHVIANANHALFLRAGEPYKLSFPGCVGDDCLTLEFLDDELPVPHARQALLPAGAILQRSLFWRELGHGSPDRLWVEEVGAQLLEAATGAAGGKPSRSLRPATAARRLRQVEAVKEALTARPEQAWTLEELAIAACSSPYHLARIFKDEIGMTIHGYLTRARLAMALGSLLDSDADLGAIGLDAGFSSHSHFTASFRAVFGVTPAALRRSARSGSVAQLRKIVTAATH